jgi:hypothetical protein
MKLVSHIVDMAVRLADPPGLWVMINKYSYFQQLTRRWWPSKNLVSDVRESLLDS